MGSFQSLVHQAQSLGTVVLGWGSKTAREKGEMEQCGLAQKGRGDKE